MIAERTEKLVQQPDRTTGVIRGLILSADRKHADYIIRFVEMIEDALKDRKFEPHRLGEDIRSSERYYGRLKELLDQSAVVIVVLDAFRPNVVYEMGMAIGRNKPLIVLKSTKAVVNVKSLFSDPLPEGMKREDLEQIQNPRLDVKVHLSDYAGVHVAPCDWGTEKDDKLYPKNVVLAELVAKETEIQAEVQRMTTPSPGSFDGAVLSQVTTAVTQVTGFSLNPEPANWPTAKVACRTLMQISAEGNVCLPPLLVGHITASYIQYARVIGDTKQQKELLEEAVQASKSFTTRCLEHAEVTPQEAVAVRLHALAVEALADLGKPSRDNYREAAELYAFALKAYRTAKWQSEAAVTSVQRAFALMRCAWTQGLPADLGEAIEALNESMVFYDADRYPVQHASLLMARGFAHASCALNVDRISNCDAAIADYSAAMTIRQEQDLHDSEPYAQLEIAEALGIKSDVADRESNCRRGLELLNQLKTQLPRNDLASALRRDELSAVFMVRLSETNPKVADCHEAIDLLQQCFRRTTDNAVKARLQLNLAYAHWVLAQTEEAGKNVRDALKALELASQIGGEAVNDITRGITHFNRGQTYLVAAAKEPRGQGGPNLEQALLAFEKATEVFTRDERPVLYAWLAERMGYLFMLRCKESGDNADQVKAMELLGDAAAVAEGTGAPLIAERAREHLEEMTETAA